MLYIYIYGNIYHQYTANVSINIQYMDPSWVPKDGQNFRVSWVLKGFQILRSKIDENPKQLAASSEGFHESVRFPAPP